jgi:hypothetical protein
MTDKNGRKYDSGKPEMSLLPPHALEAVAKVLTFGAQKYEVDNWKYVPNGEYRYKNAAMRHINEYIKGKAVDPETGEHHLSHAICCLMFILDSYESGIPLTTDSVKFDVPKINYAFLTTDSVSFIKSPTEEVKSISLSGTARPTTYMTNII